MANPTNAKHIHSACELMEIGAKAFKDRGYASYEARLHAALMGKAIAKAIAEGMEASESNLAELSHALYNHSAWRQKFEKAGIFQKAAAKQSGLDNLLAELTEEGA